MLDGLLGRGFSSKCKSLIKLSKNRIEVIRRKRNATQKYLKKDIADLLSNGLDINAYGRADGLLAELILSSCYDFVELSCDCVLKNLSLMQKQSGCPDECKTAVASLMFAAARFSDLPELRDIRDLFQERYGDSLEYSVNQKFVENLSPSVPTSEKKVRLMQDIATEFSIKWNSKDFEQRRAKISATDPAPAVEKSKTNGSFHAADYKLMSSNGNKTVPEKDKKISSSEKPELLSSDAHRSSRREEDLPRKVDVDDKFLRKHDLSVNGHTPVNNREFVPKQVNGDDKVFRKHDLSVNGLMPVNNREEFVPRRVNGEDNFLRKRDLSVNGHTPVNNRADFATKRVLQDLPFQLEKEAVPDKNESHHIREVDTPKTDRVSSSSRGKRWDYADVDIPKTARVRSSSHGKRQEYVDAGYKVQIDKEFAEPGRENQHTVILVREEAAPRATGLSSSSRERREVFDDGYKLQNKTNFHEPNTVRNGRSELHPSNEVFSFNTIEKTISIAGSSHDVPRTVPIQVRKVEEESNRERSVNHLFPPPYTKPPKASAPESRSRTKKYVEYDVNGAVESSRDAANRTGVNSEDRAEEIRVKYEKNGYENQMIGSGRINNQDHEKVHHHHRHQHHNDIPGESLPKPRSVRRRHSKSPSSYDDSNGESDEQKVKKSSSSRRRGESRRGLQQLLGDCDPYRKDEEEQIIDKLLMHYSAKPTNFDPEKLIRKPRGQSSHNKLTLAGEFAQNGIKDEPAETPGMFPIRSVSLPREQIASSETTKLFTRAASFQPDRPAQHVHPKLPDYDDLAARFAAMKGR